jgi:hypothetical protein
VVSTLQEAVLAIRLAQAPEADPVALVEELKRAFRDGELPAAEKALAEAEQRLPVETLAVEVLQPALVGLGEEWVAGRITNEQEQLASKLLRERVTALAEAEPDGQDYRALVACAPEEQRENGLLILALLLRRAGWSVVYVEHQEQGQREPGDMLAEGLAPIIASVQPHALLFSAALREKAEPLMALAERLHAQYPDLILVFAGQGFRPEAVAKLGEKTVLVAADAREAVAKIEGLMPAPAEGPPVNQAA